MYTATSTIITTWAPDMMNYIWDTITGFFFSAGGSQFTIVILILFFVVCIVLMGIRSIMPKRLR